MEKAVEALPVTDAMVPQDPVPTEPDPKTEISNNTDTVPNPGNAAMFIRQIFLFILGLFTNIFFNFCYDDIAQSFPDKVIDF